MDSSLPANKIAVVGPGLLGGSLILALHETGVEVHAWARRSEPLDWLRSRVPDLRASLDLGEATREADLIILATPIGVMPCLMKKLAEVSRVRGAIVTDVGSVKQPVLEASRCLSSSGLRFVGSHPMAGGEQVGVEVSRGDLFRNSACLITPTEETDPEALRIVETIWKSLGCWTHRLSPLAHDEMVARISHLPHVAAALVVHAGLLGDPKRASFCGNGLRDTTRIASGPVEMWSEILLANRQPLLEALKDLRDRADEFASLLRSGEKAEITRFLLEAKELRDRHISRQAPEHGPTQS